MLPYRDSRITRTFLLAFFLLVIIYAYYEARGLIYGPAINVPDITVSHEQFVTIRGTAERIAKLSMNGKPVPVTEAGEFEEPYLLAIGYNRIVLNAQDKYGRARERVIEINYQPTYASSSVSVSSSTPEVAPSQ